MFTGLGLRHIIQTNIAQSSVAAHQILLYQQSKSQDYNFWTSGIVAVSLRGLLERPGHEKFCDVTHSAVCRIQKLKMTVDCYAHPLVLIPGPCHTGKSSKNATKIKCLFLSADFPPDNDCWEEITTTRSILDVMGRD